MDIARHVSKGSSNPRLLNEMTSYDVVSTSARHESFIPRVLSEMTSYNVASTGARHVIKLTSIPHFFV
jgi:hypothetical protein